MYLNRVQIVGNVGRDPETRSVGDQQVSNFSVAVTEKWKDRNGQPQESTEWFRVAAWGWLADLVQEQVRRGAPVWIEGKLTTREWTDKDGVKRYNTEVRAGLIMVGARREGGAQAGAGGAATGGGYRTQEPRPATGRGGQQERTPDPGWVRAPLGDDDIPS